MSDSPEELMRHALGVQRYYTTEAKGGVPSRSGHGFVRFRRPYRNHFVAGADHVEIWDGLVAKGFATKRAGSELTGGDPVYYVTEAGRANALDGITFKRRWGYGAPTHP